MNSTITLLMDLLAVVQCLIGNDFDCNDESGEHCAATMNVVVVDSVVAEIGLTAAKCCCVLLVV